MQEVRKELLGFAEKNPSFVFEAITEATNGKDFSEYSTEEVISEHLNDETVERLVKRFREISGYYKNV